jgi:hypothetical protein
MTTETITTNDAEVSKARLRVSAAREALHNAERKLSLLQPQQTALAPAAAPLAVRRVQQVSTTWRHLLPEDVHWTLALDGGYWRGVVGRLSVGDRIEIFTPDFSIGFELLVQEAIDLVEFVRFVARPLFPADLQLPEVWEGSRPRYSMRPTRDPGVFDVIDTLSGETVKQALHRSRAADEAYSLNLADRQARATAATAEVREAMDASAAPSHAAELAALGKGKGVVQ